MCTILSAELLPCFSLSVVSPCADVLVRRVALNLGASGGMFAACGDHVIQNGPHVSILLHAPGPPPGAGGALYNVTEVAEGGCMVNPQM